MPNTTIKSELYLSLDNCKLSNKQIMSQDLLMKVRKRLASEPLDELITDIKLSNPVVTEIEDASNHYQRFVIADKDPIDMLKGESNKVAKPVKPIVVQKAPRRRRAK